MPSFPIRLFRWDFYLFGCPLGICVQSPNVGFASKPQVPLLSRDVRSTPEGRRRQAACACRKSNPDILVVQPAENWAAKNVPGPLDGARDRRILLQG